MTMNFDEQPDFSKEFVRLAKRYRSLPDDIEEFKKVLIARPLGAGKHFNVITKTEAVIVVKARLFCKYLKGASFRIVYAYHEAASRFEFIEIYFKGEKESEDRERIKEYLKNHRGLTFLESRAV
ncbi:MAG: hypothetical protein Q8N42_00030 [bacterium]|nr:hypothetical protein [bacterium]